jgi:hypothetical protein
MEGEPVANPSADQPSTAPAANPALPRWAQTLVAILGAAAAFLVAVEGIPKLFPSGVGSGTPPGALQSEAEEIAKELFAGEYGTVRAKFSDGLSAGLSVQMMQQASQTYITPLGNLHSTHPQPATTDASGQIVVNVICNAEKGNLLVVVIYDQQGKANGLWVKPI